MDTIQLEDKSFIILKTMSRNAAKIDLLKKSKSLPTEPGCYLMKSETGKIIYVGKAKNLKNRVRTYFDESKKFIKTEHLVRNIVDFEFIITSNEIESLVLENNLIKQHSPRYNIRLKDDKTYPYLQIRLDEKFPRLEYTRRPNKKHTVFGPFPESFRIKNVLNILTKVLRLRDCSLNEFKARKTPCLLHQMYQCDAPCVRLVTTDFYQKQLQKVLDFFKTSNGAQRLIKEIEQTMQFHSQNEEFEKAILIRDYLLELKGHLEEYTSQEVESHKNIGDVDILGFYYSTDEIDFSIYSIRNNLLIGCQNLNFFNNFESYQDFIDGLPSIILQYYFSQESLPRTIIISEDIEQVGIKGYFEQERNSKITIKNKSPDFKNLIQATKKHAENSQRIRLQNKEGLFKGLQTLKELLKLSELPRHLECYDVAVWQGQSPASARISFKDGKPDKKNYRHYSLAIRPEGNNDFAMLEETLTRRIKDSDFPDVFIVDGGKQQVSTFQKVLEKEAIQIPVIGIAKSRIVEQSRFSDKTIERSEERLIIPGRLNPFILSKSPELMRIITQMRDEAHRFSRKLHHKKQSKDLFESSISKIKGIGEKTYKEILQKLDVPVGELKKLTPAAIAKKLEISLELAEKIKKEI